jgi:hypothetical protein
VSAVKFTVITLAILVTVTALSVGADRPQLYGLSLPYPTGLPDLVPTRNVPYMSAERLISVLVDIDRSGEVVGITAEKAGDSSFANHISKYLRATRFEPATRDDKEVDCRLPVLLHYRLKLRTPDIYFPVDTAKRIANRDLYFKAFTFNGVEFPGIESFPSFFCDLEWHDSLLIYPFAVIGLDLDATGAVTAAEKVLSSNRSFVDQIMSASLWATFSPARVNNQPVASHCFLIVSLYPHSTYPTRSWHRADSNRYTYLENQQLQLIADTVGLLSLPIFQSYPGDRVSFGGRFAALQDTVMLAVKVSATGDMSPQIFGHVRRNLREALVRLLKGLKFFPAFDYQGEAQSVSGLVRLTLSGSGNVRIEYFWLPT